MITQIVKYCRGEGGAEGGGGSASGGAYVLCLYNSGMQVEEHKLIVVILAKA